MQCAEQADRPRFFPFSRPADLTHALQRRRTHNVEQAGVKPSGRLTLVSLRRCALALTVLWWMYVAERMRRAWPQGRWS